MNIRCSKCNTDKEINEYSIRRNGKSSPYRLTYCNECRKKQIRETYYSSIETYFKYRLSRLKAHCKKNKLSFNLDLEFLLKLWNKQKGKCFYSDIEMVWKFENRHRYGISFDRIKHNEGYTKDNIVLCCTKINTVKSDLTLLEIEKWMPDWYSRIIKFKTRTEF